MISRQRCQAPRLHRKPVLALCAEIGFKWALPEEPAAALPHAGICGWGAGCNWRSYLNPHEILFPQHFMNPPDPQTPEPIRNADLESARILDQDGQVISAGRLNVGDDGLCHFHPSLSVPKDIPRTSPRRCESIGSPASEIHGCHQSGTTGIGCQYHFRYVEK